MKLLVNTPRGTQEVIEIQKGGGYFDLDLVLWDERVDGELPAIELGGMERIGNDLVFNQERMEASIAADKPAIPQSITALQGLLIIDQFGLAVAYEAWADSPERTFAQKAFINKAQTWKRDDPTLLAAAQSFSLSDSQIDTMFIEAAKL